MKAGIALGSNLGDRAAHLAAAKRFLSSLHAGPCAPLCSVLHETEPVDCSPGTAAFLNAVVEIESPLEPLALLARLREFETQQGRALDRGRNAPRPLDLDLLYVGNTRMDTPALVLPHPRMTARRFVLQPLAEACIVSPASGFDLLTAVAASADASNVDIILIDAEDFKVERVQRDAIVEVG